MSVIVNTYSFADVNATIAGPGLLAYVGNSSAPADEGMTFEKEAKNTKTVGADGSVMHSMHANESGKVVIRLLKTSPVNAILNAAYNFQASSSLNWGQNKLVLVEIATGDVYTCEGGAFAKHPNNVYATQGNTLEWEFDFATVDPLLGTGVPQIAA